MNGLLKAASTHRKVTDFRATGRVYCILAVSKKLQPVSKIFETLYHTVFLLKWPGQDFMLVIPPPSLIKVASST